MFNSTSNLKSKINLLASLVQEAGVKILNHKQARATGDKHLQVLPGFEGMYNKAKKAIVYTSGSHWSLLVHEAIHALHHMAVKFRYRFTMAGKLSGELTKVYKKALGHRADLQEEGICYHNQGNIDLVIAHYKRMLGKKLSFKEKAMLSLNSVVF